MMDDDRLEELLQQYVPSADKKQLDAYPEDEEIEHEFSEQFEKKMDRLIRRVELKEKYKIPVRTGQRAAVLILVILMGMLAASMSVRAVREKLFEIIKTVRATDDQLRFQVEDEEELGEFTPRYPGYIPEGFEKTIDDVDEMALTQYYERGEDLIIIGEDFISEDITMYEDNEYISVEREKVRGTTAEVGTKKDGTIDVRWFEDNCRIMVEGYGISKEEVLKICESLQ